MLFRKRGMSLKVSQCNHLRVLVAGAPGPVSCVGKFQMISNILWEVVHGIEADALVEVDSHTLKSGEDVYEVGMDG